MAARLLLIISASIFMNACGYHKSLGEAETPTNQGLEQERPPQVIPPVPGLDFGTIRQVLNSEANRCAQCHDWTNDYGQVLPRIESIIDRVTRVPSTPGFMPRGSTEAISAEDIELLVTWLDSGAPESSSGVQVPVEEPAPPVEEPLPPVQEPLPPEVQVSRWESISKNIIAPNCLSCHASAQGWNGNIGLSSYEEVFANREKIKEQVISLKMPMDSTLAPELLTALVEWIDQGAQIGL